MLGYDRETRYLNIGDTAELYAYAFDKEDAPEQATDVSSVQFTIQRPDGAKAVVAGAVQSDGGGFLRYTDTDLSGEYRVVAKFTLNSGQVTSTLNDFIVLDPFGPQIPTDSQLISNLVWDKLEDLFDSADGGPWMKDMTLNIFDREKIPEFIADALLEINVYNPPTHFGLEMFTHEIKDGNGVILQTNVTENTQVLVLGTFLGVVRHLMRSYVEQPAPTGGQITYEDRRDYLQRWGTIYQIEYQRFDGLLKLWKRQFLNMNQGKGLVSSKAGRLLPAPLRTRNVGRGYY